MINPPMSHLERDIIFVRIPGQKNDRGESVRKVGKLHVLGARENSIHFFARLRAAEDLRWEIKMASLKMEKLLVIQLDHRDKVRWMSEVRDIWDRMQRRTIGVTALPSGVEESMEQTILQAVNATLNGIRRSVYEYENMNETNFDKDADYLYVFSRAAQTYRKKLILISRSSQTRHNLSTSLLMSSRISSEQREKHVRYYEKLKAFMKNNLKARKRFTYRKGGRRREGFPGDSVFLRGCDVVWEALLATKDVGRRMFTLCALDSSKTRKSYRAGLPR